ncbi:hypothetical protein V1264_015885 [Littorina saxatilis]|uniref:Uncharacterized protein n=1 Tax=Littorina saxatilis TaxID=31220 RepID=A0AAN9BM85_9CAEN
MEWHLLFVAVTYLLNARSSYGNVEVKSAALSTPPNLPLICTNNTWIHVTKEVYVPNCSSPGVSEKVLDSSSNLLHVNCVKGETSENQTRTCNETTRPNAESFFGSNCTDISVNISYECVAGKYR